MLIFISLQLSLIDRFGKQRLVRPLRQRQTANCTGDEKCVRVFLALLTAVMKVGAAAGFVLGATPGRVMEIILVTSVATASSPHHCSKDATEHITPMAPYQSLQLHNKKVL